MKPGDIVKHRKIKHLLKGHVVEVAKSGMRVRVEWKVQHNPKLQYQGNHIAYYRIDMLENIEEDTQ